MSRRSVLVTGAARGIGLAVARRFAASGCFVGLFDVDREALEAIQKSGEFLDACFGYCDVTSGDSVAAALRQFADRSGGVLDVLVNNAGVLTAGSFADISPDAHERMIAVNVTGLTRVAQTAFPYLRDTPDSALVNLCSASSIHGIPGLAVYSASKFYVDGFTQALALEWEDADIHVTCVKPPIVDTAMGREVNDLLDIPGGIEMTVEQVAEAVEEAAYGYQVGKVLGLRSQLLYLCMRLLPESARLWLMRRVLA